MATHPFSAPEEQPTTRRPRYLSIMSEVGYPWRRAVVFGMHIHVAVATADKAIQVTEAVLEDLPPLIALGATSPFWRGHDTGLASTRLALLAGVPRTGIPPPFDSFADYQRALALLREGGCVPDASQVWWDVRSQADFGTIEIRALDAQPCVRDTAAFAGLVQALVRYHGRRWDAGRRIRAERFVLSENRWQALRHGMDARLLGPDGLATTVRELLDQLFRRVADDAGVVGAGWALAHLEGLAAGGGRLAQMRRRYAEAGHVTRVAQLLVDLSQPAAAQLCGACAWAGPSCHRSTLPWGQAGGDGQGGTLIMGALKQLPQVIVQTSGRIPRTSQEYARGKVQALLEHVRDPILTVRVRLTHLPDPAVPRHAIAQATLDVNGRLVRAHVAAPTMREAIDRLQDRLRDRLDRLNPHWEARRGGIPLWHSDPLERRHASEPTHRPEFYPRPVEERQVVRHKTFAFAVESVDEAAFELESMDYDFHLFTEIDTGQDCVLYRAGPTGYRLAGLRAAAAPRLRASIPLTVSEQDAPTLDLRDAIARLELGGLPFVFFADAASGRGVLLYHRYDGHYGMITSAGE